LRQLVRVFLFTWPSPSSPASWAAAWHSCGGSTRAPASPGPPGNAIGFKAV